MTYPVLLAGNYVESVGRQQPLLIPVVPLNSLGASSATPRCSSLGTSGKIKAEAANLSKVRFFMRQCVGVDKNEEAGLGVSLASKNWEVWGSLSVEPSQKLFGKLIIIPVLYLETR